VLFADLDRAFGSCGGTRHVKATPGDSERFARAPGLLRSPSLSSRFGRQVLAKVPRVPWQER
jgi:hypothetical protein